MVTRTGDCGFAIKVGVAVLNFLGYKRINFKTDQEESILTLKEAIHREWKGEIVNEEW